MKKVDLYEILEKDEELFQDIIDGKLSYTLAKSFIYGWMKEACEQTVDLCIENAELQEANCMSICEECGGQELNKKSILKTKKQII
jgi:hypothetical protein